MREYDYSISGEQIIPSVVELVFTKFSCLIKIEFPLKSKIFSGVKP